MPTPHYLHVHIPGRGQVTLSLPGGIERALRNGRLPDEAIVWHAPAEVWIPLTMHPEVARLQDECDFDYEFLFESEPGSEPVAAASAPSPVALESVAPSPNHAEPDPAEPLPALPLIPVGDWEHHIAEFSKLVARATAQEQRREAARNSGALRRSESIPVFVAGTPDPVLEPEEEARVRSAKLKKRLMVGATAALVLMAAAGYWWYQQPERGLVRPVHAQLTARERDSLAMASAGSNLLVTEPNPLGDLEAALENDLRTAEAVIWQPAIDFGTGEQVLRSSRKIDAVRNSIGLYRLGAWRLVDSLDRQTDPRLEPFAEADRVDQILRVMQRAVVLLDSLTGHYRVDGEVLVFDSPADAAHYTGLALVADSLLRSPIELDSFPQVRAPRRVVTRLLSTLPAAVIPPSQP
jgi:hypothetical protein